MRIQTFYRLAVWLPIVIPALVAGVVNGLGFMIEVEPVQRLVFVLLASLVYGAVPYALLALWATWWIGGRPESEIRRLAFRAPLLMVAVFAPMAVLVGIIVDVLSFRSAAPAVLPIPDRCIGGAQRRRFCKLSRCVVRRNLHVQHVRIDIY